MTRTKKRRIGPPMRLFAQGISLLCYFLDKIFGIGRK